MSKLPEVRIKYGWHLEEFIEIYNKHSDIDKDKWKRLTMDQTLERVEIFTKLWKQDSTKILEEILKVTDLEFKKSILDIYIVSGIKGGISTPTVISANIQNNRFVTVAIHELIHIILTDNKNNIDVRKAWEEMDCS